MIAVIQRVASAKVYVEGQMCGSCENGFLLFLGVQKEDTEQDAVLLADKIAKLRVLEDEAGKLNCALSDVGGGVLAISNFTLCADYRKGTRPGFSDAMRGEEAKALYDFFCAHLRMQVPSLQMGLFGADMQILADMRGPVTISLDSRVLSRKRAL